MCGRDFPFSASLLQSSPLDDEPKIVAGYGMFVCRCQRLAITVNMASREFCDDVGRQLLAFFSDKLEF